MATRAHDIVIIGGGIAGLTVAAELARRGRSVTLLEYYPKFGGRVATFRDPKIGQYEIGAGRIFRHHERVKALIKKYGLHTFPISAQYNYGTKTNIFLDVIRPILAEFQTTKDTAKHTIEELIPSEFHTLFHQYPYDAELRLQRADIAIESFMTGPMSAIEDDAFFGVVEGLDTITSRIATEAKDAGVDLRSRYRVDDITQRPNAMFEIQGMYGKKATEKPFIIYANTVIIATCRCSLGSFSILKTAPLLKQLATSPLLRIYAKFPVSRDGTIWFRSIPKTVVSSPLRYIIPIDPTSGLIMISYTDGRDTAFWKDLDDEALETAIMKELHTIWPHIDIPNPTYVQKHYWGGGCTYWLPGLYDVHEASMKAMNPKPNLYIVGESISPGNQAWIEGALETAETLLKTFF
jgi:hypothetical protein